jgi:hypothetical protein
LRSSRSTPLAGPATNAAVPVLSGPGVEHLSLFPFKSAMNVNGVIKTGAGAIGPLRFLMCTESCFGLQVDCFSAIACGERVSLADAARGILRYPAAARPSPCRFRARSSCPLVSMGIHDTSGEAAFTRPRLGQALTPLGVNTIALARTVITDSPE